MQQTVEAISALERRIDLTLPADAIEKEIRTRLGKLARTTKMPGFRPGKVPMRMVEQSYGAQVHSEVLNEKVGEAFQSAVNASNLRVAGTPRLEAKADAGPSELAFTATFEVFPEIKLGDISQASVNRAVTEVGEAEIDRTLDIMRKQRVSYQEVARVAADGDRATIDFVGTDNGVAFEGGTAKDFPFVLGEGKMLPDFETAVRGMAAGEKKTFSLTFPADYGAGALASKTVQFEVTVLKVEAPVIPAIDADFAKSLGVADGDIPKMREEVKANLQREVTTRLKARTKDAVMNALLASTSFDVPKSLIEADQERLRDLARADMAQRGMQTKDMPIPLDIFAQQAERRVRLGLLVGELVREYKLQSRQDQVRKMVEDMSQSYERPQDVINWYLSDRKRLADLESMVLEDNVVSWVLERAKVVETPVPFDELMGHEQK